LHAPHASLCSLLKAVIKIDTAGTCEDLNAKRWIPHSDNLIVDKKNRRLKRWYIKTERIQSAN